MTGASDVETSLGRTLTDSEVPQVNLWISDAELLIRARLGDLTLLDAGVLEYVVREAVVMKLKRPDEATRVDISVDDGSVSKTYERATGQITILDEWWAMLSPAADNAAAFSTRPTFTPDLPTIDLTWA